MQVYAAQPREGTETNPTDTLNHEFTLLVYAAQPREGTETRACVRRAKRVELYGLCSSTPRGDGNYSTKNAAHHLYMRLGLCSSTPRGDGNLSTIAFTPAILWERFMQLNPARGRKQHHFLPTHSASYLRFMQLNPARGRKPLRA